MVVQSEYAAKYRTDEGTLGWYVLPLLHPNHVLILCNRYVHQDVKVQSCSTMSDRKELTEVRRTLPSSPSSRGTLPRPVRCLSSHPLIPLTSVPLCSSQGAHWYVPLPPADQSELTRKLQPTPRISSSDPGCSLTSSRHLRSSCTTSSPLESPTLSPSSKLWIQLEAGWDVGEMGEMERTGRWVQWNIMLLRRPPAVAVILLDPDECRRPYQTWSKSSDTVHLSLLRPTFAPLGLSHAGSHSIWLAFDSTCDRSTRRCSLRRSGQQQCACSHSTCKASRRYG